MATCQHCGCDPIQYALAQTEIKGHMRVKDDLQARIAELEKALVMLHESKAMNAWAHDVCRQALKSRA